MAIGGGRLLGGAGPRQRAGLEGRGQDGGLGWKGGATVLKSGWGAGPQGKGPGAGRRRMLGSAASSAAAAAAAAAAGATAHLGLARGRQPGSRVG